MTKIIYPNKGRITTNGKLTSLLELGAGFHPDFQEEKIYILMRQYLGLQKKKLMKD